MEVTNDRGSWLSRNGWAKYLLAGTIMVLSHLIQSTVLQGSGFALPGAFSILVTVSGAFALFMAAFKASLSDAVSAKVFSALVAGLGFAIAIWQILDILKH
ncbi:hypothetical protein [Paraburkholderia youngii]|uniref:hypothetical protein n=1 Tax=Paraburkholderia youngii TaxID=2782701 RepID=UPI003D1E4758